MIDSFFLEREAQEKLFLKLKEFLQKLGEDEARERNFLADYIRLELKILKTLGYEIDLSSCAVTGLVDDLAFVSPKSARAVSFDVGKIYEKKLLKLPKFLLAQENEITNECLLLGLDLSGFFLQKFLLEDGQQKQKERSFFHREKIRKSVTQPRPKD